MRDGGKKLRPVHFSARTNWDVTESAWSQALEARRSRGLPVYDLTAANPTQCGFRYDEKLLEALQHPAVHTYEPSPLGLFAAREAICEYYRQHLSTLPEEVEFVLEPSQVLLTTSTSEAYSFLFRLLCDPGDEILVAQPSYPLFDFLAVLDDVKLAPYLLFYDYGWHLDLHSLRSSIGPRTRAIVIVHPNNPTGHFTSDADRHALESVCLEFGLALIVDEVFLDYGLWQTRPSFATGSHPVLTFVLSGLSKIAGLPQMKLSWIAAFGPAEDVSAALERLVIIADTFLSVSAPLQFALPIWLRNKSALQQQIHDRVLGNLKSLDAFLEHAVSLERLVVEGGWYAMVRAPATRSGEEIASWLLKEEGIAVHTGEAFGMPAKGYVVVSLLPAEEVFREGVARLVKLLCTPV